MERVKLRVFVVEWVCGECAKVAHVCQNGTVSPFIEMDKVIYQISPEQFEAECAWAMMVAALPPFEQLMVEQSVWYHA